MNAEVKDYTVNGVLVTHYKQWAVSLMKREAGGEQLSIVSTESWREVLGYQKDVNAKQALEGMKLQKEAA